MDNMKALLRILRDAFAHGKIDELAGVLAPSCTYRSDLADNDFAGAEAIIARMKHVNSCLPDDGRYFAKIIPAKSVLRPCADLPEIYNAKNCIRLSRGNTDNVAAFVFVSAEEGKLTRIYLSRDARYIQYAFPEKDSPATVTLIQKTSGKNTIPIKELLKMAYGESALEAWRKKDQEADDDGDVYIWKQADFFVREWLPDQGYNIEFSKMEEDCIGYHCTRKGMDYAVFVYAYGEERTAQLDGDYCARLVRLPLSKGRIVLVLYLHVKKEVLDGGKASYAVMNYMQQEGPIDFWHVTSVNGRNLLEYYPCKEMHDMVCRFIAAYNKQSLDILQTLMTRDAYIEELKGGRIMNDDVYGHFSYLFKNYGKMWLAYVRYNDVIFSSAPYLTGFGFFDFSLAQDSSKICRLGERAFSGKYQELFVADAPVGDCAMDNVPAIEVIHFFPPEETQRFAVKVCFANGEVKKYRLPTDRANETDEMITALGCIFTDKIFANGWLASHRAKPDKFLYANYPECGQGIEFINGCSLGAVQLYHDSTLFYEGEAFEEVVYESDVIRLRKTQKWPGAHIYAAGEPDLYTVALPRAFTFHGGHAYTLVHSNGCRATSLEFSYVDSFYEGLAAVCVPGYGYGYINKDIKFVIPPAYNRAHEFNDGFAQVALYENGRDRWLIIDKTGKALVFRDKENHALDVEYERIENISDGMFCVSTLHIGMFDLAYHSDYSSDAGLWGYVDYTGKQVIAPQYIYAFDFYNGVAIVCKGKWTRDEKWDNKYNSGYYWTEDELWGLIDKEGNEILACQYGEIRSFWDSEYYMVYDGGRKAGEWAAGKWGVVDHTGKWVVEPIFKDLGYEISSDGCFAFYAADKWSDPDNVLMGIYSIPEQRILFEPQFLNVSFRNDGTFQVSVFDKALGRQVERIIDHSGNPLFESHYTWISTWKEPYEMAIREKGHPEKYGLIDKHGNMVLPCKYDVPWNGISAKNRRMIFKENGKQGLMDFEERVIIPALYDELSDIEQEFIYAKIGKKNDRLMGLLTQSGETMLPVQYDSISVYGDQIITKDSTGSTVFLIERRKN